MSTTLKKFFPKGTLVKWSASAENFHTSSGEMILNNDTTLNIELKNSKIALEWDGGGTKSVFMGNKIVTSTSPICVGDDGPLTDFNFGSDFSNDSTTKNVFIDAVGLSSNGYIGFFNYDTNVIKNIEMINSSHITKFNQLFANMQHIKTVSIDTSGATELYAMFAFSAIENPPYLNTSNVTNADSMFYKCTKLKNIPLYDFSNVTNMNHMFTECSNLTNIPQLDTHNVKNIEFCFSDCTKLESVPLLDFSNVENIHACFSDCTMLKSVPLLDFSKVTDTFLVFSHCNSLKNVGGFIGLKTDISFLDSPLTHDSALNVINNLATSSGHMVEFKKTTFDTLTPAEIAKATDKGWTITYL